MIRRLESLTKRTRTELDDLLIELLRKTKGLFILLIGYLGGVSLPDPLTRRIEAWLQRVLGVGLLVQGGSLGHRGRELLPRALPAGGRRKRTRAMATALGALGFLVKAVVWAIFVLLILQNLGVEITALLAGVSVGGIAVALAVQNVLGDLLGSLSIVLDKPFVIGDFIVVGEFSGTVEHVGLKSTHIRSVSGEQLVFSNSDLLNSRIRNYKRMQERRAVFTLGVTYDTPPEKLEAIPEMVEGDRGRQEDTRFDRSHFKRFSDYSLDIETVFHMTVPDYDTYMDVQQAINLELVRLFAEEGIEFAFPTQTLHLREGLSPKMRVRKPYFRSPWREEEKLDPAPTHSKDLKGPILHLDLVAHPGDPVQAPKNKSRHGVVVVVRELESQGFTGLPEGDPTQNPDGPRVQGGEILRLVFLVLVLNLPDDLFQKVFQRHKAGRPAEFIHDDDHLHPFSPHLGDEVVHRFGGREELNRANDRLDAPQPHPDRPSKGPGPGESPRSCPGSLQKPAAADGPRPA